MDVDFSIEDPVSIEGLAEELVYFWKLWWLADLF